MSLIVPQVGREPVQRRDLGARAPREDRGQAEVVDVLVGDHQQLDVLDRMPPCGQGLFELVQRLARVGPRVDQRQRVILDQIRVDAPDLKRRRYRQAMDARLGGPREQLLLALRVRLSGVVHERISASTSSRRRSMSSRETQRLQAQAQQRLGVRRAHVEVPVLVVDRDAVQPVLARVGVALGELRHLGLGVCDLGVDLAGDEVLRAQ